MGLGDGNLNLPYEEDPDPTYALGGDLNLVDMPAGGLIVLGALLPDANPPLPALVFRFVLADGSQLPGVLLAVEDAEWDLLVENIKAAIESARKAAA